MSNKLLVTLSATIVAALMALSITIPLPARATEEVRPVQSSGVPEITAPQSEEPKPPPEVTLALVGDILLDSWVGAEIRNKGVDYPWEAVKDILSGADVAVGNLESSVALGGKPLQGKRYTFRARPETLEGAVNAGMDVLTLANNHVLDYGTVALEETLGWLDHYGIARAGAGKNVYEAFAPAVKEVNGLKVGVLAFSRVVPYGWWVAGHRQAGVASGWDNKEALRIIQEVDSQVDILVISIHWGKELADYPAQDQINLARSMVDSGADIILGHHSHCLQGVELYKDKTIMYSVGNFIFTSTSLKARTGAIALIKATPEKTVRAQMIPTRLNRGQPQLLTDKERIAEIKRLEILSQPFNTKLNQEGYIETVQ